MEGTEAQKKVAAIREIKQPAHCQKTHAGHGMQFEELQASHPCFGKGPDSNAARIHLPVSPGCNIGCRFCQRSLNRTENRPGVASRILTPQEALDVLERALAICPSIKVAGIAGPGDTLATDQALETFRLIRGKFPRLIKCMSTNGLLLAERAEELIEVGVDTLTVTVNAVDPAIESRLNRFILYHRVLYEGEKAASILIQNQLNGIQKVTDAGMTVKVNTVLVPGINDGHIETIAAAVAARGAQLYNIIPLLPQYELADIPEPDCMDIETARMKAGKHIDVFRHCQRCRADAIGIPGKTEYGSRIYQDAFAGEETFSHG